MCQGKILGNNSNIRKKNALCLPDISLRNTVRKPSHRVYLKFNTYNNNNNNNIQLFLEQQ